MAVVGAQPQLPMKILAHSQEGYNSIYNWKTGPALYGQASIYGHVISPIPIGSTGLVYLPTWIADFHGKLIKNIPIPWILLDYTTQLYSHTIHVWYMYLHLVDFYGFHVGKYTHPMGPMGSYVFPHTALFRSPKFLPTFLHETAEVGYRKQTLARKKRKNTLLILYWGSLSSNNRFLTYIYIYTSYIHFYLLSYFSACIKSLEPKWGPLFFLNFDLVSEGLKSRTNKFTPPRIFVWRKNKTCN